MSVISNNNEYSKINFLNPIVDGFVESCSRKELSFEVARAGCRILRELIQEVDQREVDQRLNDIQFKELPITKLDKAEATDLFVKGCFTPLFLKQLASGGTPELKEKYFNEGETVLFKHLVSLENQADQAKQAYCLMSAAMEAGLEERAGYFAEFAHGLDPANEDYATALEAFPDATLTDS